MPKKLFLILFHAKWKNQQADHSQRKRSISVRISLDDASCRFSLPNDNNLQRKKQKVSEEASEAITFFQAISPIVIIIPSLKDAVLLIRDTFLY